MLSSGEERVERGLLQRGADRRSHLRPLLGHVEAGHGRTARCRRQQRRQHVHRRRLTGAVRTEEAVDLPRADGRATLEGTTMASTESLAPPRLEAWVSFLRSHAAITRELSAQLQREHGLTLNDYEVLLHLSHAEHSML